jgi:hypothetical protein
VDSGGGTKSNYSLEKKDEVSPADGVELPTTELGDDGLSDDAMDILAPLFRESLEAGTDEVGLHQLPNVATLWNCFPFHLCSPLEFLMKL